MPAIGRNDPCPCGSGRKFKYCCGRPRPGDGAADARPWPGEGTGRSRPKAPGSGSEPFGFVPPWYTGEPEPNPNAEWKVEMREFLGGRDYDSLEDLQAATDAFFDKRNRRPVEDFSGLSSEQVHHLLDFPFDSPMVTFAERLEFDPGGPFIKIFGMLADAVQSEKLKPTAKGNLPRRICQEIAAECANEETISYEWFFSPVNGEDDFPDLHVVRIVAEIAGFLRKYKGRFILGRKCRARLDEGGLRAAYPPLFEAYVRTFNWGYRDRIQELPFLQSSFAYSLFLLQKFGSKWRPDRFYSDQFARAFPIVLDDVEERYHSSTEDALQFIYSARVIRRFAGFMGLARVEGIRREQFGMDYRVKALPLLGEMVRFKLS